MSCCPLGVGDLHLRVALGRLEVRSARNERAVLHRDDVAGEGRAAGAGEAGAPGDRHRGAGDGVTGDGRGIARRRQTGASGVDRQGDRLGGLDVAGRRDAVNRADLGIGGRRVAVDAGDLAVEACFGQRGGGRPAVLAVQVQRGHIDAGHLGCRSRRRRRGAGCRRAGRGRGLVVAVALVRQHRPHRSAEHDDQQRDQGDQRPGPRAALLLLLLFRSVLGGQLSGGGEDARGAVVARSVQKPGRVVARRRCRRSRWRERRWPPSSDLRDAGPGPRVPPSPMTTDGHWASWRSSP